MGKKIGKVLGLLFLGVMALVVVTGLTRGNEPVTPSYAAPSAQPAIQPVAPAVPSGPLTIVGQGEYEVGVDMEAGKYKTPGPGDDDSCYYEINDGTDGIRGIKKNGNLAGPGTITLKKGQFFKSGQGFGGCIWTKVP